MLLTWNDCYETPDFIGVSERVEKTTRITRCGLQIRCSTTELCWPAMTCKSVGMTVTHLVRFGEGVPQAMILEVNPQRSIRYPHVRVVKDFPAHDVVKLYARLGDVDVHHVVVDFAMHV